MVKAKDEHTTPKNPGEPELDRQRGGRGASAKPADGPYKVIRSPSGSDVTPLEIHDGHGRLIAYVAETRSRRSSIHPRTVATASVLAAGPVLLQVVEDLWADILDRCKAAGVEPPEDLQNRVQLARTAVTGGL